MIDALYIAATGMHAELAQLDTISNNLANLNTTAFKKSNVSFDDLMYRDAATASELDRVTGQMQSGLGAGIAAITKDFSVGDLRATENALDVAIRGLGFLEVDSGNGQTAYTRNGALKIDAEGYLATVSGQRLTANIQVPADTTDIQITPDGAVSVRVSGEDGLVDIGRIEIASFLNPTSLEAIGENLYIPTEQSGGLSMSTPGEDGTGQLAQRFLEGSNVNLVSEMMSLVVTQRAYEVNSQVIRAVDEMLRINNSLRG